MDLLIVRHAIAFERSTQRWPDDGKRPLSPRGVLRAHQAAAGLKLLAARPQRVLSSPLLRTRQTAEILTRSARWPKAVECPLLAPGSSPERLLALLAGLRERRIAIVGHQPDLGSLLSACLPGDVASAAFELKKMGAALVEFPGSARGGHGTLLWLAPPRLLRAAR